MERTGHLGAVALGIIRWWFGVTYLLAGVGGVIAGPIMVTMGDYGGIYMVLGGGVVGVLGWAIHPWGLQGMSRRRCVNVPLSPGQTAARRSYLPPGNVPAGDTDRVRPSP